MAMLSCMVDDRNGQLWQCCHDDFFVLYFAYKAAFLLLQGAQKEQHS